jgi:hypothetical protein
MQDNVMIQIIPAKTRHFNDFGWLKTYWLFSFSDYYDPENIQFGALRVFNDDVVEGGTGFPAHPHNEMEIITIVLDGEITHEDSMGNRAVIRAGDVQRMSAGTGLTHSELNGSNKPVHFYQIWIHPDTKGIEPSYDQRSFSPSSWKNRLLAVASGQGLPDVVTFNPDATIYRTGLNKGQNIDFKIGDARKIFVYMAYGDLDINGTRLGTNDQARIDSEKELLLSAHDDTDLILIDVPA